MRVDKEKVMLCYRDFITSCKEDLSVKHHFAVTIVSSHWYNGS